MAFNWRTIDLKKFDCTGHSVVLEMGGGQWQKRRKPMAGA